MDRHLDGMYFRVMRDGKWCNVCVSDMTDEEMEATIGKYKKGQLFKVARNLAHALKEVGDHFDIMAGSAEEDNEVG